ncbi:MAG TPA: hypothetical protein VMM15_23410 [Bradyrhizobium sp.]|nr:hypothetical protein [Bradyrhizobium sp.]
MALTICSVQSNATGGTNDFLVDSSSEAMVLYSINLSAFDQLIFIS